MMYSRSGFVIYIICVIIFVSCMWKGIHAQSCKFRVMWAASDLVREQDKMGKETELNDNEIIRDKILPKSNLHYALNPFTWTLKQMSANDDLLQACIDAKDRDDVMDAIKYKSDLSTFEERFKTWEINLEKAKLSLLDKDD